MFRDNFLAIASFVPSSVESVFGMLSDAKTVFFYCFTGSLLAGRSSNNVLSAESLLEGTLQILRLVHRILFLW